MGLPQPGEPTKKEGTRSKLPRESEGSAVRKVVGIQELRMSPSGERAGERGLSPTAAGTEFCVSWEPAP